MKTAALIGPGPVVPLALAAAGLVLALAASLAGRDGAARRVALLSLAGALGAVLGLFPSAAPLVTDVAVPGGVPLPLVRLDRPGLMVLAVLFLLGIAAVLALPGRHAGRAAAATAAAVLAAAGAVAAADLAAAAICWTLLVALGAADLVGARLADDAASWASLAVCGAPALLLASAVASPPTGAVAAVGPLSHDQVTAAAVVLVGAASAGAAPLNGWLRRASRSGLVALIGDGLLPLAGITLIARTLMGMDGGWPAGLPVLLAVLGTAGIAEASFSASRAGDLPELSRAVGQGEASLALYALALGTPGGAGAALFLTAASVLARTSTCLAGRGWLARIGWASMAGLPPLPGWTGRWLVLLAALDARQWALALAVGAAVAVLGVGQSSSTALFRRDAAPPAGGDPGLFAVLALAGLAPGSLAAGLFSGESPAVGRSLSWPLVEHLVAAVVPLAGVLPLALVRTRPRRRRAGLGRSVDERLGELAAALAEDAARAAGVIERRFGLAVGIVAVLAAVLTFVR